MSAKEEIKKSAIAETVKILVQLILLQAISLVLVRVPAVRDHIWPAIPKWLIAVIAVSSLSGNFLLFRRLRRHHWELAQKEEHANYLRHQIELRTSMEFRFNAYWNQSLTPHCPSCKTPMGNWISIGNQTGFRCSCGNLVPLKTDSGRLITPSEAKDILAKERGLPST